MYNPDHLLPRHAYHLLTSAESVEEAGGRVARLQEFGIPKKPDPEFDAFARTLAEELYAPIAGVNLIGPDGQYFPGLYIAGVDEGVMQSDEFRTMELHEGWCTLVMNQRRTTVLALEDVEDFFISAANPVIDKLGIRAYLGAPLLDPTGALSALGTIFVLDRKPHPWGMQGVEFIKAKAAELVESIHRRASLQNEVS